MGHSISRNTRRRRRCRPNVGRYVAHVAYVAIVFVELSKNWQLSRLH